MVEESFFSEGITTNNTKFEYVVGEIPLKYAVGIKDIIMTPTPENRYIKIQYKLAKCLRTSQEEKLGRLLS